MLTVDIPSVFTGLNKLIEDYLNEPKQKEKKELVNSTLIIIDNILKQGNPVVTIDDYAATTLEHYIYDHLDRSHILMIALLRPDLYQLFKTPFLKEAWDDVLIACSPLKKDVDNPLNEPVQYIPFPHIHSIDILISNFLHSKYYEIRGDNQDAFIKSSSFLAYAAVYGSFPAIEKSIFELYTYIKENKEDRHKEELTTFFYQLLDEASKAYLHLGIRLRGYYLILMNKRRTTPEAQASFMSGHQSLLIAWKFEQYIDDILIKQKAELFKEGFFSTQSKNLTNNSDLIKQYQIIKHNATIDGYYRRKFLAFEAIDLHVINKDLLNDQEYNVFIDNAVQNMSESSESLFDILNNYEPASIVLNYSIYRKK